MEWFYYDDSGDPYDPLSYAPVAVPFCPGNSLLCAIRAFRQNIGSPPVPRPTITSTLQAQITATLMSLNESSNVLLKT